MTTAAIRTPEQPPDSLFEAAEALESVAMRTRRLSAYPAYKPSGVEWLPEIPRGWSTKRLRFAATINPTKSEVRGLPADTAVSFLPMEALHEFGGMTLDQERPIDGVMNGYTYFRDGDVVIAKITPCFENGKGSIASGLTNGIGFGTTELHVLRVRDGLDRHFAFYLTLSHPFREIGAGWMYGAGGQKRVPDAFLADFRVPLPPLDEQRAIAAFLRRETAKIDALVEKKRRLIDLLREKRTALISHAVTKGLNPDAPMKPSGIDWLGDVPKHWEVMSIKHALSIPITDGPHETPDFVPDGIPFLSAESLKNDQLDFDRKRGFISPDDHARYARKYSPKRGDVFMVKSGATTGNVARVETDKVFSIWSPLAVLRPHPQRSTTDFIFYFMKSRSFLASVELAWSYGTQQNIGMGVVSNLIIALPPLEEQWMINNILNREAERTEQLVDQIQAAIARLTEYRSALISAAVTGKIDVRGLASEGVS